MIDLASSGSASGSSSSSSVGFSASSSLSYMGSSSSFNVFGSNSIIGTSTELSFTPPFFKDEDLDKLELQDPASPARKLVFKLAGNELVDVSKFVEVEVVENTDYKMIKVRFSQTKTNLTPSIELIACYSYQGATKL